MEFGLTLNYCPIIFFSRKKKIKIRPSPLLPPCLPVGKKIMLKKTHSFIHLLKLDNKQS